MALHLLAGCVAIAMACASEDTHVVKTVEGLVRGMTMTSFQGRNFLAFRGMRYAQPPVGPLRFKPPKPMVPWDGIENATTEGSICPQLVALTEEYIGNEDCLFLNVYTHQRAVANPVIVWIHGGAFYEGHGGVALAEPYYMLDHDIVLVTLNYRLGPLGFLSTGDSAITGNYGFKDTVAVLQWVKKNIAAFGGDPNSVTAFGYSSGAASVQYLTLSPLSKGLVHRVIIESGSALHKWAFKSSPLSEARKVAELVGCPSTATSSDIAKCLASTPAEQMVRTLFKFPYWGVKIPLPYAAVLEKQKDCDDPPFLTAPPDVLVSKGLVHKVPAIIGVTVEEFIDAPYYIKQNATLADELDHNLQDILLNSFLPSSLSSTTVQQVKQFYFRGQPAREASLQQLIYLFSDATFNYNSYLTAVTHAAATEKPVFVYVFSFRGRLSTIVKDGVYPTPLGVAHGDDLFYVFRKGIDFPNGGPNPAERTTIMRLTKLLSDFACTGDPTPRSTGLIPVKWEPIKGEREAFRYLDIGSELQMHSGLFFPERMPFWLSLIESNTREKAKNEL